MPDFDPTFRDKLKQLFAWRRDVRRFRRDPVDGELLDELLDIACLAPSVGNSQPWRFVKIEDAATRAAVTAVFERCNKDALEATAREQGDGRAALYARLKLEGLREAPVHLAAFAEEETAAGHGLGRRTMPETLRYSAVLSVHTLWLAARSQGLGLGWVSILDPEEVAALLDVPGSWSLIAYLCIGYPEEEHLDPELERHGWQGRETLCRRVLLR
jgi:5,6-dimethylbenzimidazole synthase